LTKKDEIYKGPKLIKKFKTQSNLNVVGCLLSYKKRSLVLLPGEKENWIQIYDTDKDEVISYEIGEKPSIISGNLHGEIFAYSTKDGLEIKLFKISDGSLFKAFSRGANVAEITSISFDRYCLRMAVASKKDTVHVFSLPKELALCGRSEEELKQSIQTDMTEDQNSKSLPDSLLESRVNQTAGIFSFFSRAKNEKSYLKVYIP
jgi:hypothetical protein